MAGGAQLGNQNARKAQPQTAEEKREYQRLAMQKQRALLRGDIKQAQQFVGRPRKRRTKGDIFDVAARLEHALKALVQVISSNEWPVTRKVGEVALKAYHDYWEND